MASSGIAILLAFSVSAGTVLAHFTDWASYTDAAYLSGLIYDTRIPDDTYRMRTTMYWNSTKASAMRHMATEYGYRFTDDVHVTECTISATTRRETNLENPYWDRDRHACPDYLWRWEEAELVAEDAGAITFPVAGTTYYTHFYFARWGCNQSESVCYWDPDYGNASYTESISDDNWLGGDKWNTVPGEFVTFATKMYPYAEFPSASAEVAELSGAESVLSPAAAAGAEPGNQSLEAFSLAQGDEPGEVMIRPDLSGGLERYAEAARALARDVVTSGPARGVITFSRPVSPSDLDEIAAAGVQFHDIEAVSELAADGTRWTVGNAFGVDLAVAMSEITQAFGVQFLGVVSAEVTVPNRQVLDAATARDDVWLVDLSIEQVSRSRPNLVDVGQNDLYWWLAGW